ncbi:MAG: hypothetical protein FJ104_16890, partial [Deltaproteobacteria bacterium]|nr:hypothetical protein [Deltaproteobacteria bacterium]
ERRAALAALGAALEAAPDHLEALESYANLAEEEGEHARAEDALLRLSRALTDADAQAATYRRLATLYAGPLDNLRRADVCFREVLRRKPDDDAAEEALIDVRVRLRDLAPAVELQSARIERATTPERQRDLTLGLARVHELAGDDQKAALSVLEKARKAWPHDPLVLRATAELLRRAGDTPALTVLLDRSAAEARRALAHGRFEVHFFAILSVVAEIRGDARSAALTTAVLDSIECRPSGRVAGAGTAALDPTLDDLIAPDLLSPALRGLLTALPGVLDGAFPVDLRSLRAIPLPLERARQGEEARALAEAAGLRGLEVLESTTLGVTVVPASSAPPRLVVGTELLTHPDAGVRQAALARAVKILATHGAALSRLAPIELGPAIGALLAILAPSHQPQGVDAARLADARRRLEPAIGPGKIDQLGTAALEVAGTLGNRTSQLGQALGQWGTRVALLATGNPDSCLRAVAAALDQPEGPPAVAADRLKWVLRHPEARDLGVFATSEAVTAASERLGLRD